MQQNDRLTAAPLHIMETDPIHGQEVPGRRMVLLGLLGQAMVHESGDGQSGRCEGNNLSPSGGT